MVPVSALLPGKAELPPICSVSTIRPATTRGTGKASPEGSRQALAEPVQTRCLRSPVRSLAAGWTAHPGKIWQRMSLAFEAQTPISFATSAPSSAAA